jgi:predicted DNA-binding transcriptional regulator YafY
MAKQRKVSPPPPAPERAAVTPERFTRLYRLLHFLAVRPQTRDAVSRRLGLDVRGFYRDLEVLRAAGIAVTLTEGRYSLASDVDDAVIRLPFPDPRLTLGEAQTLATGRSKAHRRLKEQISQVLSGGV